MPVLSLVGQCWWQKKPHHYCIANASFSLQPPSYATTYQTLSFLLLRILSAQVSSLCLFSSKGELFGQEILMKLGTDSDNLVSRDQFPVATKLSAKAPRSRVIVIRAEYYTNKHFHCQDRYRKETKWLKRHLKRARKTRLRVCYKVMYCPWILSFVEWTSFLCSETSKLTLSLYSSDQKRRYDGRYAARSHWRWYVLQPYPLWRRWIGQLLSPTSTDHCYKQPRRECPSTISRKILHSTSRKLSTSAKVQHGTALWGETSDLL